MDNEIKIDYIGGVCPIQAEGTINGEQFYFRSRHQHWSLCIGKNPILGPHSKLNKYYKKEKWGEGLHSAGFMNIKDAKIIIKNTINDYLKSIEN